MSIPMAAYVSVSGEESTAGEEKGEERVEKVEDVEEEGGEEEEGKKEMDSPILDPRTFSTHSVQGLLSCRSEDLVSTNYSSMVPGSCRSHR